MKGIPTRDTQPELEPTPAASNADAQAELTEATWSDHARAGRLNEALAVHLSAPQPGGNTTQLLDTLIELRGQLRAKSWARAAKLVETLGPEAGDVAPNLRAEVALLKQSGEYLERGEAEAALTLLERVELPLLLAEAETQRGTAQVFLGDAAAAEQAFRRAAEHDPNHYRAVTNLGNVALEANRVDEAIAHYERALKLNENFSNAHHNLGVAYRRKGQVHKSVQSIRKAQRVGRQHERDDARSAVRALTEGRRGKYLKWLLWALVAVAAYFLLQALQVI